MLKKTSLIFFVLLQSISGYSQLGKTDMGLNISGYSLLGTSDNFGVGVNGLGLQTSVFGYISDNTAVLLNFNYTTMQGFYIESVGSYYNSYAFVPSLRNDFISYYTWKIFAEFGFGLGTLQFKADDNQLSTDKHSDLSGGISILKAGLGGNYQLNDAFGIEFFLPITYIQNLSSQKSSHVFSGFAPTFGFTYSLN